MPLEALRKRHIDLGEEHAWLCFYLPRQAAQTLARLLPLARLRDALPESWSARLRLGLYPARVEPAPRVTCARRHPPWGDPAELDPQAPVRYPALPEVSIL